MSQLQTPVHPGDHILGPSTAPVTLVEYADFQCPYCADAHEIVQGLREQLGDKLRFVFRHFPLSDIHVHAQHAAEFAEAAGAQGKFWEVHDYLFEHQDALDDEDLVHAAAELGIDKEKLQDDLETGEPSERVDGDFEDGLASGVQGTPAFFINGHSFPGAWNEQDVLLKALKEKL